MPALSFTDPVTSHVSAPSRGLPARSGPGEAPRRALGAACALGCAGPRSADPARGPGAASAPALGRVAATSGHPSSRRIQFIQQRATYPSEGKSFGRLSLDSQVQQKRTLPQESVLLGCSGSFQVSARAVFLQGLGSRLRHLVFPTRHGPRGHGLSPELGFEGQSERPLRRPRAHSLLSGTGNPQAGPALPSGLPGAAARKHHRLGG